jgi:hypothetical protein
MNQLMNDFPGYVSPEADDGSHQSAVPESAGPTNFVELMELHDIQFVKAAYPIMLARAADPVGLNYYVNRLRHGYGRVSVLDQLSRSHEACKYWHACPGIREALMKFRASRRLKGWKVALTDIELGRAPGLRRLRALQNSIGGHRQRLEEALAMLSHQQEIVKYLVSNLGMKDAMGNGSAERQDSQDSRRLVVPEIRSRHIEEVRSFDLPSAARTAIDALRF